MIDKLCLTTFITPDKEYLETLGDIITGESRVNIYRYLCRLDKAAVFYYPHKFSDSINANIPFTKIDINPKDFEYYKDMEDYLYPIFNNPDLTPEDFNVSRIDIAVDIANFPIDTLLSMLKIKRIRSDSLSFFKGTVYAGSNPKIRIYDKVKEIKARLKKGREITKYEQDLIDSENSYTRFEIQIRSVQKILKDIIDDPACFASYFDRLEIFDFGDNEGSGVLQVLYKYINRKFRKELEKYRNLSLVEQIKEDYIASVKRWFNPDMDPF